MIIEPNMADTAESAGALVHVEGEGTLDIQALKQKIMREVESKLLEKDESLWRRGQAEIRKLQQEQDQLMTNVQRLREQQDMMTQESQKMQGALAQVTSKFELVVKEMREALRAMPQLQPQLSNHLTPSPSVASTSASDEIQGDEQACHPTPGSSMGTPFTGFGSVDRAHRPTPQPNWNLQGSEGIGAVFEQFDEEAPASGPQRRYRTPPRMPLQSPAVLSLASALPSVSLPPLTPGMSPGFKRLHLADVLEGRIGDAAAGPSVHSAVANRPTTPRAQGSQSPGAAEGSPSRGHEVLTVVLNKEPGFVTLGIEVNQLESDCLRVESVDDHGLVGRHNSQQKSQDSQVLVSDRIIEVNGLRQDTVKMLSECKVKAQLTLTIERDATNSNPLSGTPEAICRDEAEPVTSTEDSAKATRGSASSPKATRLCPNARVFVPSARKEPSVGGPPGLESYTSTTGLPGQSPGMAASTLQHAAVAEVVDAMPRIGASLPETVDPARRALFP